MRLSPLLALVFCFLATIGTAQTSAVVFTEMGEEFTLYLNGSRQNDVPSAVVKVDNLSGEFYIARIDFADDAMPDFSHNNFAVQPDMINNYVIKPNRKGKYVIRYFPGSAPQTSAPAPVTRPAPAAPVQAAPAPAAGTKVETSMTIEGMPGVKVTETHITETTDPKSQAPSTKEEVKVDMSVGGTDVKIEMSIPNISIDMAVDPEMTIGTGLKETHTEEIIMTGGLPDDIDPIEDCSLSSSDYNALSASIKSKSFSDSKMTIAQQALASKCPTSAQVRDLMGLFDFEDDRLELAKYAYDRVSDPSNFYQVNDAFTFEMTIDELNEYILSK